MHSVLSSNPLAKGLLVLTIMVAVAHPVVAQESRYDHSAVIHRILGSIRDLDSIPPAQTQNLSLLVSHLMERGQLLIDLYEFERTVGRDYAQQRDSIGRNGGPAIPGARYFLGRSLQELGQKGPAGNAYQQVAGGGATPELRALASAWNETLTAGGQNWQSRVMDWRVGKSVPASFRCPAGAGPTCELFRAVLVADHKSIRRVQARLLAGLSPDYTYTAASLQVEFHDPLTLLLLGAADFSLAARVAERLQGVDAVRGLALMRAGKLADAESILKRAATGGADAAFGKVYLGEVRYRRGDSAGAEQLWRQVGPAGSSADLALLEVQSGLGLGREATVQRQRALGQAGLQRMRRNPADGIWLARALLRHDNALGALGVLDAIRPLSNDLDQVKPQMLVLHARARYLVGRREEVAPASGESPGRLYALARSDLSEPLAVGLPVARPLLAMLQELTAPAQGPGQVR